MLRVSLWRLLRLIVIVRVRHVDQSRVDNINGWLLLPDELLAVLLLTRADFGVQTLGGVKTSTSRSASDHPKACRSKKPKRTTSCFCIT